MQQQHQVLIQLGIQLLQLVVVEVVVTMDQVLLLLVPLVDQVVAVDLEVQVPQLLQWEQEEQEIHLQQLHPQPQFKGTLADLELVTTMEAVAAAVLQQLEAMQVQLDVVHKMLEMVALENKIILMVTIITGPVVVAVDLTIIMVELVELAAVVVPVLVVVLLELEVEQQLMLEEMVPTLVHLQIKQVVMVELILVVVELVLVIIVLMLETVDQE